MNEKSKLDRFKTSQLDLETSLNRKGGTTTRTGTRTTVSVATDIDCFNKDCDGPDPLENVE